jgi:oxygen-independent coproporphyrinogen III oxidase
MAGVYIHIPYCKVKCHYCDFHFSTQHLSMPQMVQSMKRELAIRQHYLKSEPVSTIYFGGGTPSLLSSDQLSVLVQQVRNLFTVAGDVEITVECNPDDLNASNLQALKRAGVTRLSIGIQSFDDDVLKFMNRAHTAAEAAQCIELARETGFENITVDLIYGIPGKTENYWQSQVAHVLNMDVPHLSAYCLTIEPQTYFGKQHRSGNLIQPADEESLKQFQYLMDAMRDAGYEHYEIANFAKPGFISRHNSAYWLGTHYLGIGPSAHSYNGMERSWNVANNAQYIQKINAGELPLQVEELSLENRFNDYVLTRLRTKWGITRKEMDFIPEQQLAVVLGKIANYERLGLISVSGDKWVLTDAGKYRADGIAADLFI